MKSRLLSKALVAGTALFGGCAAHSFKEVSREPGKAIFQGERGILTPGPLELYVCNEATFLGEKSMFDSTPVIDYLGIKDTFVEGEPIKFVLYWKLRDFMLEDKCLVDLVKDGEVDPARRRVLNIPGTPAYWLKIVPYNGLDEGNYSIACYRDQSLMGKIDFQVVSPNENASSKKR